MTTQPEIQHSTPKEWEEQATGAQQPTTPTPAEVEAAEVAHDPAPFVGMLENPEAEPEQYATATAAPCAPMPDMTGAVLVDPATLTSAPPVAVAEAPAAPAAPETPDGHRNYIVLTGVSVRKVLGDLASDFERWVEGEMMGPGGRDYPDHTQIGWLLEGGHIAEAVEAAQPGASPAAGAAVAETPATETP